MARKLLLADDSITVQRVIELTFADEGLDIVTVGDGTQAIERLNQEPADIVLADLNMPGADGYAVAEHIKRRSATLAGQTRVVLLTGAFEPVDPQRARQLGVDGILEKPFEPQIAIELVRRLLEQEPLAAPRIESKTTSGGSDWTAGVLSAPVAPVAPVLSAPVEDRPPIAAGHPFEPGAAAARSTPAELDDYFKRLDEALTNAGLRASPAVQDMLAESREIMGAVTHVDAAAGDPVMTSINASTPGALTGAPADAGTLASPAGRAQSAPPVTLVDAFSALLAGELGETPEPPPVAEAPAVALHAVPSETVPSQTVASEPVSYEPRPFQVGSPSEAVSSEPRSFQAGPVETSFQSSTADTVRMHLVEARTPDVSSVESRDSNSPVVESDSAAADADVDTDRAHVIGFRGAEVAVAESSVADFQEAEASVSAEMVAAEATTAEPLVSEAALSEPASADIASFEAVATEKVAAFPGFSGVSAASAGFGLARAFTPVTEPIAPEPVETAAKVDDAPAAVESSPAPVESAAPVAEAAVAAVPAPPAQVSEEMVEAVVRRVLAEMTDKVIRDIVSTQVLDVAERLVREEIERLKADAQRE